MTITKSKMAYLRIQGQITVAHIQWVNKWHPWFCFTYCSGNPSHQGRKLIWWNTKVFHIERSSSKLAMRIRTRSLFPSKLWIVFPLIYSLGTSLKCLSQRQREKGWDSSWSHNRQFHRSCRLSWWQHREIYLKFQQVGSWILHVAPAQWLSNSYNFWLLW